MISIRRRRPAFRFQFPHWLFAAGAVLVITGHIRAQEPVPASRSSAYQKDEVDRALDKAVAYLVGQQGLDGSIDRDSRRRGREERIGRNSTALTSLAIMAIASLGHSPADETPEGEALQKALACMLHPRRQREDGYFGSEDSSRMYGHGIATLMLAELLGMGVDREQDRQIRARLQPAVELILRSQKMPKEARFRGGWRYEPDSRDADLSVTVWQVMALRSARGAGIEIPKEAIDQAAEYIRRSYTVRGLHSDAKSVPPAGFAYQPEGEAKYATAAAGLLSLQVCGFYDDPTVEGSADWLLARRPSWETDWFFYGTYYYAQGMHQRGGRHAEEARNIVRQILLAHQEQKGEHAGSWDAHHGQEKDAGRTYTTSLAVLSLSVKYHYLPIYQR